MMNRLALSLARRGPTATATAAGVAAAAAAAAAAARACPRAAGTASLAARCHRAYATSAPKKAEEASAQSGGSRSKDAEENIKSNSPADIHDTLPAAAKGRTGGGEPLESSENPPPRPKIHNSAVPGTGKDKLTKEQQDEVDRHNADFEKKHDRAAAASDDKVDKNFWSGHGGTRGG